MWTGNMVLSANAYGGVYITGGVALILKDYLLSPECKFIEYMTNKGRFKELISSTPVYFVHREVGLDGAEQFGIQTLRAEELLVTHTQE